MRKESAAVKSQVAIIGAGMAGCEAAYFLATKGISVLLCESKRVRPNPAQKIDLFAELVCTNSLKSKNPLSAHGMLKQDMQALGSVILKSAQLTAVPAGDALAVDREAFSKKVTETLSSHPLISICDEVIENPAELKKRTGCEYVIVASGPLTLAPLETWIQENLSADDLYFYDAIAPVVDGDSLDLDKLYFKDRHSDDPSEDYLNAPLNQQQYERFIEALVQADKVPAQNFEDYKFFESCLPIDIMAERGAETARFSCLKPLGLPMPNGEIPHAVVQLRKENLLGSAYNLVGFQNRLTYSEQKKVFRLIPGFEQAEFLKLGSVHRNSFLNARKLFLPDLSCHQYGWLHFAGQITGVEGYTESAAMGLYVAHQVWRKLLGKTPVRWPVETGIGALVHYILTQKRPSPSNINFGLFPSVELTKEERRNRKELKTTKRKKTAERGLHAFNQFKDHHHADFMAG